MADLDLDSFDALFADVVTSMCAAWTWICDDACFQEETCKRQVLTRGKWTAIYQPHKGMMWSETEKATVWFRVAGADAARAAKAVAPRVEAVCARLLEDVAAILAKTGGRWLNRVDAKDAWSVLNAQPLRPDAARKMLRLDFSIRGSHDLDCRAYQWVPRSLAATAPDEYANTADNAEWVAMLAERGTEL